jgi:hypothetical protein
MWRDPPTQLHLPTTVFDDEKETTHASNSYCADATVDCLDNKEVCD